MPSRAPLVGLVARAGVVRSRQNHQPEADARAGAVPLRRLDDFYALWLDPRRVYSCAYYRERTMTLAQAQEAKLDHICRKLMLREGERFLDIGAGWAAAVCGRPSSTACAQASRCRRATSTPTSTG